MNKDINIGEARKNCYRQSKVNGEFMLQMRVPGGVIPAHYLKMAAEIADRWGDGNFHIGTRQSLAFTGINYDDISEVNKYIRDYITDVEGFADVDMDLVSGQPEKWNPDAGYPTIGARNVTACIGNVHCICGNVNTQDVSRKVEKIIFPSNYHIKTNVSGCPNDCNKANMCDFGIVGVAKIDFHPERCIGCGKCVEICKSHATRVLCATPSGIPSKDDCCCVGCAECVRFCPTGAWTRNPKKFFRVIIGGRTGRQTPRAGKVFLNWASEEVVLGAISNWQKFSAWALDYKPKYLHGGHLIDRAGYMKFKELILEGVELNPECMVAERINWSETEYRSNFSVKYPQDLDLAGPGSQDGNSH